MKIEISIIDDKKGKEQSFEAKAKLNYRWDNSWLGYGSEMEMTAFGSTAEEATERLIEELFRYQSELVKALSKLTTPINNNQ
jgi:hypothetical protein